MDNHSVISFLQRPQLLSSFRWQTSATRSQNLYTLPTGTTGGLRIPTGLINRPMARNKLDGFTSFKATACIELLVNAQPFQCGRLLMAAVPMPSLLGHRADYVFSHVAQTQNLQHVQMDIAKDTKVCLEIPFISPYNCFDLIEGRFDWAELRILVYSPLNSINGDCIECNVYGYFKDIQLGAPTSGEFLTQQSASPSSVDNKRKQESTGRLTGALAQLGNTLMTSTLNSVSPLLSAGDKLLAAAGWSKPILSKPSQVVLNRPQEGFAYMDGVDQSLVLAMTASNAVENIPNLVGTGIDETDFHRLKRMPQMVGVFRYSNNIVGTPPCSTGDNLGTQFNKLLWSCAVAPTCYVPACYNVTVPPTTTVLDPYPLNWKQPTTLNYISSPFLYWTGSLVYTFKFVKTDYHSGRVEIAFHPFINSLTRANRPEWLAERMDYVYRTVIDLRKNSEVSVTIPYIAAQPWKRVSTYLDPMNPNPPAPGRAKDLITGLLTVRALTPLFATQTVPPTIEVLVEMRAGDDYEVQGPVTSKFLPFSFGNVDIPPITQQSCSEEIIQQGLPIFKMPSSIGRIYTNWSAGNNSPGYQVQLRGFANYPLVYLDYNGSVARRDSAAFTSPRVFSLTPRWDNRRPTGTETHSTLYIFWASQYDFREQIIIPNPQRDDILYINFFIHEPIAGTAPNMWIAIDCCGYGITEDDPNLQTVRIADSQLPLRARLEQPDGPLVATLEDQPISVRIDDSQLPLPTANQGSGGITEVRISGDQLPLQVNAQQPLQVELLQEQFPLQVAQSQVPLPVEGTVSINQQQLPLPTTGGGGGGVGGTVSIDPDQLPLWVSEYNIAPKNPREITLRRTRSNLEDIVQQSGGKLDKLATSGITETRTSALEGWMPPSISGNEKDAHRPSTVQYCAGERFTSLRQYSRRFAFCLVSGLNSQRMMKIQPVELVRPGILTMRTTTNPTGSGNDRTQYALYAPNTGAEVSGSPLSFVAGMYAFYRGSTRFKVWMDPRENPPNLISGHLEYSRQQADVNIIDDNIENFMTPIMYETPNQKQIAEFQVPYYSPTIVSSTWSHGVDSQFDVPLCNLVLSIPDFRQNSSTFPIKVAVAAGDDMDFHQFIGPPPVINVGDLLNVGRQLHYPPTGFTPTQKIVVDTARTDVPATGFIRVPWNNLTVSGNPSGGSCPPPPAVFAETAKVIPSVEVKTHKGRKQQPMANRVRRDLSDDDDQEGVDEVDIYHPYVLPPDRYLNAYR